MIDPKTCSLEEFLDYRPELRPDYQLEKESATWANKVIAEQNQADHRKPKSMLNEAIRKMGHRAIKESRKNAPRKAISAALLRFAGVTQ